MNTVEINSLCSLRLLWFFLFPLFSQQQSQDLYHERSVLLSETVLSSCRL